LNSHAPNDCFNKADPPGEVGVKLKIFKTTPYKVAGLRLQHPILKRPVLANTFSPADRPTDRYTWLKLLRASPNSERFSHSPDPLPTSSDFIEFFTGHSPSCYLPLGVRAANASLRQVDPSVKESATILGASWTATMREITLPLILPVRNARGR
jgi:hypothetical protein